MTKQLKSLFHFLGGIRLALALIAIAALMTVAGTFIESKTESHLLAARWTYSNPFFLILLSLFFINILFAALRRWPFQIKHIPFLITHLGLLMVIGGTMVKNQFGIQGQLSVWEGSENHQMMIPHSHALVLDRKGEGRQTSFMIPLSSLQPQIFYPFALPQLKFKLSGYAPHVKEKWETWVKGAHAHVAGFPLIPIHAWSSSELFPQSTTHPYTHPSSYPTWTLLALRTPDVKEAAEKAYLQGTTLRLKARGEEEIAISLENAINEPVQFLDSSLQAELVLFPTENSFRRINLILNSQGQTTEKKWTIPLEGQDALLVKPITSEWLEPPFTADLERTFPSLVFIEDANEEIALFAFDPYGRIHHQNSTPSQAQTLLSFDEGFNGYGVQTEIPFPSFPANREKKMEAEAFILQHKLEEEITKGPLLSPPLQLFQEACKRAEIPFCQTFIQFLTDWNAQGGLYHKIDKETPNQLIAVLKKIEWSKIPKQETHTAFWSLNLIEKLERDQGLGLHPIEILEKHRWPLVAQLKQGYAAKKGSLLNLISQQMHAIAGNLPPPESPDPLSLIDGRLLSAYFRNYGIDYRSLFPYREEPKEQYEALEIFWKEQGMQHMEKKFLLETSLTHRIIPESQLPKLEEQRPGIVLEVQEGDKKQTIALAYDPSAAGFKWPLLNGRYVVRFQPEMKPLPYSIRLRKARQLSYPQSQQIYSYESDIAIAEEGQSPVDYTLSMNHVYETKSGYRFYLSGIGNSADQTLKRIQLAVNYDPAKFLLTYPGAFLVFLGTTLLFWGRKKKRTSI